MTAPTIYRPGTVVKYAPTKENRHDPMWCREGIAVADDRGALVDTYWGSGSEAHCVRGDELATVEVLFHLDDYDEFDRWRPDEQKWLTYAPEDRQRITMQHGLQRRLFIRKGAVPHRDTVLAGLREKVAKAEAALESAQRNLQFAQEDLDALLAAPEDCSCRPSLCAEGECPACAPADDWRQCKSLPDRIGGTR